MVDDRAMQLPDVDVCGDMLRQLCTAEQRAFPFLAKVILAYLFSSMPRSKSILAMKFELLSFVLPFNTSSPMMRHAAVATYLPSGWAGTGVIGKMGAGLAGRSVAIALAEVVRCRAIEALLYTARVPESDGGIEVTTDREARFLELPVLLHERNACRIGDFMICSIHLLERGLRRELLLRCCASRWQMEPRPADLTASKQQGKVGFDPSIRL